MKNKTFLLRSLRHRSTQLLMLILCSTQFLFGQQSEDQSQSPYFHVISEGHEGGDFPLVSTSAEVNIVGPIADVTVTQVYRNDGVLPMEAIYVFPGSTRAAVYEMTMYVGDRIIKADIQEKNQARKTYESAKKEGKRASLLEQHRPNVFQMNVANICPGDEIKVELRYNEFIIPEDKVYAFVYPTVVGPRFTGSSEKEKGNVFPSISYTKEKELPSYDFDIQLELSAGMKLHKAESKTHRVNVTHPSAETAKVVLHDSETKGGNRDFIFEYSLAGDKIAQGTMLYEHGDEKFFLSVVEPPSRVNEGHIPPREYVFVMDVSGSMNGFPIDISKKLMHNLVSKMRPVDKFNVLLFASSSSVLAASSLIANKENLEKAYRFIDNPQGGGGTRLLPALRKALNLPVDNQINSRSIVVVTDGYVSVEREAFKLISNNLNKSNLFAFGIGSSVNRHLIEGMAHAGRGEAFIITDKKYAMQEANRFQKYIQHPILTNISVEFEGIETYDVIPASIPDLMAERPLYVFGKYKGAAKGKIKITGFNGKEKFNGSIPLSDKLVSPKYSPIRYLWAREKIRELDDLNSLSKTAEDVKILTDLGLKYNLLTKYTSFVAVDEIESPAKGEATRTVKQSVPLPQGVSNYAVGFEMGLDEVVKAKKNKTSSTLSALVAGTVPMDVQAQLKKLIETNISFTKAEKAFLNGNTLTLTFDRKSESWTVTDERDLLTQAFREQFVYMMNSLYMPRMENNYVTISMIWI